MAQPLAKDIRKDNCFVEIRLTTTQMELLSSLLERVKVSPTKSLVIGQVKEEGILSVYFINGSTANEITKKIWEWWEKPTL